MRVQGVNTAGSSPHIKGATDSQAQQIVHRALMAIKAGRYNLCQNIVAQGLKQVPDDHDLLFIRAFLAQDRTAQQTLDDNVSAEVRQTCVEQIVDYKTQLAHTVETSYDTLELSEEAESQRNITNQYTDLAGIIGAMVCGAQGERSEASPQKIQRAWMTYGGIVAIGLGLVLLLLGGGWWSVLPLVGGIVVVLLERAH